MNAKDMLNRNTKNILEQEKNLRVPEWWTSKVIPDSVTNNIRGRSVSLPNSAPFDSHQKFTKTRLVEMRKRESVPDISYDIDGDGFVGGKDYVIARRFDHGQKNYLTDQEK